MDLHLKQLPTFPAKTTILASGHNGAGKTAFATYTALRAIQAGMNVVYLDSDHSFKHKLLCNWVAEMLKFEGLGKLQYVSLPDMAPFQNVNIDEWLAQTINNGYLLIVDDIFRGYRLSLDNQGPNRVHKVIADVITMVKKSTQARALISYTTFPPEVKPGEKALPPGVDLTQNEALPIASRSYPVQTAAEEGLIRVDVRIANPFELVL